MDLQGKTYKDAQDLGYKDGEQKYERGYVSRKIDVRKQRIYEAKGFRTGEFYVRLPCYNSSQYCIRQYLTKKD